MNQQHYLIRSDVAAGAVALILPDDSPRMAALRSDARGMEITPIREGADIRTLDNKDAVVHRIGMLASWVKVCFRNPFNGELLAPVPMATARIGQVLS